MLSLLFALMLMAPPTATDGGFVTLKGQHLLAEVARTPVEREKALAYRQSFKAERCMFVIPSEEGPHPVCTAKFLIPFDVAWIDAEGTVVEIQASVPPCRSGMDCPLHGGTKPSRYHLFLATGTLRRLKVVPEDKILWDLHFMDGTHLLNGPEVGPNVLPKSQPRLSKKRSKQGRVR